MGRLYISKYSVVRARASVSYDGALEMRYGKPPAFMFSARVGDTSELHTTTIQNIIVVKAPAEDTVVNQEISGSASYTYVNVVIRRCGNMYCTVYSRNYRNTLKSAGFRNL